MESHHRRSHKPEPLFRRICEPISRARYLKYLLNKDQSWFWFIQHHPEFDPGDPEKLEQIAGLFKEYS